MALSPMKLFLVSGSLDLDIGGDAQSIGCFPNIGMLTLASAIQEAHPHVQVIMIDGSITETDEMIVAINRAQPDIVGLSAFTPTYHNSLRIAQAAKSVGATVVMGNDHATHRARQILARRPDVDGVFAGDHVTPSFVRFVGGAPLSDLPGVWYRDGGDIKCNPEQPHPLDDLPWPDFTGVDLKPYWRNYNARLGQWHNGPVRGINTQFASGCGWGGVRCLYCDIHDLGVKHRRPETVWPYIRLLVEQHGINLIYEVCDSLTSQVGFIRRLVKLKPDDLNPEWLIYGRAQEIVDGGPELIALLKQLNVVRVNIGIDAGSTAMLRSLRKGNREGVETNLRAAQMLARAGIQLHCSLVLGSVGETPETLAASIEHARELHAHGNVVTIDPSPLLPLPGAPSWGMFETPNWGIRQAAKAGMVVTEAQLRREFGQYLERDNIPTGEIVERWIRIFTHCTMEDITNAVKTINLITRGKRITSSGFGIEGF